MPEKADCEDALGTELGSLFYSLYNSYVVMCFEWRVFSEWFRCAPERIDLLNRASGSTALVIQNALVERAMVKLSRLTDPSSQGRNKNASLEALCGYHLTQKDVLLDTKVREAKEKASVVRKIRSKRLVHADHGETLFPSDDLAASYADLGDAMRVSGDVIQHFSQTYLDTHISFDVVSPFRGDEVSFLKILYLGLLKQDEINAELEAATSVEDYERELDRIPEYLRRRFFADMMS